MQLIDQAGSIQSSSETKSWNSLWRRSAAALPTLRSECLTRYINQFSRPDCFRAPSVTDGSRLVAALPLIARRKWNCFRVFEMPSNPWMICGDLLLDQAAATGHLMDQLVEKVKSLPASLISINWVFENADWRNFVSALRRAGCQVFQQKQFDVGFIDTGDDWETYVASWSKNHRKKIHSRYRRLALLGDVELIRCRQFNPGEVRTYLREAFDIEHRGWKGESGTSVLATPGMFSFYCDTAERLANASMLEIHFLTVAGRKIAFDLGYLAKGTYHSHKVGFDPEFAKYMPGQLLMYRQLQDFFAEPKVRWVDTMGELTPAIDKWCNQQRTRYRYLISTGGPVANTALKAYGAARPLAKRILKRESQS